MTIVSQYKVQYPEAWKKILQDTAFTRQTKVKMDRVGKYKICNTTEEAVTHFLESCLDNSVDIKELLGDFFRLNKCIGKISSIKNNFSANMIIMVEGFLDTAKIGLSFSKSSLERSSQFQNAWEMRAANQICNDDYEQLVSNSWHLFCKGAKIRWCFETKTNTMDENSAHCLNCRLSISDDNNSKTHLLLELSPLELRKPTALDAGTNLYGYWRPGGCSSVKDSCKVYVNSDGFSEYVFQPSQRDLVKVICKYKPCQNC